MRPPIPAILLLALSLHACQAGNCDSSRYRFPERQHESLTTARPGVLNPAPVPEEMAEALNAQWELLRGHAGVEQLGVAVGSTAGTWKSPLPATTPRFYWASVGKLVTGILVQQLVQEGRLRLDQRLETWYPSLPGASNITLQMLLSHRAGLPSYSEFAQFRNAATPATPEQVAAFLEERQLLFCPGTDWYYSNSGYMLLGRIIERVTGESYAANVERRIAQVIGADSLAALPQGSAPTNVAQIAPPTTDETAIAPGDPFSAGNIVATPIDMIRVLMGLLNGRLVSGAAIDRMVKDLYPMFDARLYYGLGVMVYDLPNATWLGHSGGTPGARAVVAYSIESGVYAAVALTGEGSPESIARVMMELLASAP